MTNMKHRVANHKVFVGSRNAGDSDNYEKKGFLTLKLMAATEKLATVATINSKSVVIQKLLAADDRLATVSNIVVKMCKRSFTMVKQRKNTMTQKT